MMKLHHRSLQLGRHDYNGLHGNKAMWRITGMDETKALAATVERLMAEAFA